MFVDRFIHRCCSLSQRLFTFFDTCVCVSLQQVSKFAKAPQGVPASVIASTTQREQEEKWFAEVNKPDLPEQKQPESSVSISAFPSAPTTMPTQQKQQQPQSDGITEQRLDETAKADAAEKDATKPMEETIDFSAEKPKEPPRTSTVMQQYALIVKEGDRGYGPEALFGSLVTGDTTRVSVVDPAMRCARQLRVFLRFCEVVLSHATGPVIFELRTQRDPPPGEQMEILQQISAGLHAYNGSRLIVTFAESPITQRTVSFDNGARVRCSRGIDIYQTHDVSPWSIGMCSYEQCLCHAATFEYAIPAQQ